ncbi:CHASE3 domain-containing protein [Caulobacter sp. KR2-114]|uniref:CHASE3 domain-containing protein n=1 Tax=Caulobacter sp. KR2-114 TaxID=3400912 RepID=UPI003C006841
MGFNRVLSIALFLALLLASLVGLFVYNHAAALADARRWVSHTHEIIEENQRLLALIEDAETGERGYLLTEDPGYLEPYRAGAAALPSAEAQLARLTADNPGQVEHVAQLNALINARLAFLTERVRQAEAGDFEGARAQIRQGDGPVAMRLIRTRSASVDSAEQILLRERTARAAAAERLSLTLGLMVAALALLGLLGAVYVMDRTTRRLSRALAETQQARAALDASTALVTAFFANTPDYLMVLDIQDGDRFVLAEVNPAFERALRVKAADIRGRAITDLLPAPVAANLVTHYARVRRSDRPVLTRNVLPNLPDGPRTWESILAPVAGPDGQVDRIIGSIRDITERVRGEERLRGAQRMEAVGQLTGGVAHDFNNLLQVIRGNLELLEPALVGQETAQRRLRNALYGAERAAQLTRQLLAFARRQPLEPQVINLSRLFGDMSDLLRRTLGESVEIETVVAGGLWNTVADPAQVESAILNLAINARDAMPDGGRLTIEITNATLDDAYVRDIDDLSPGQYVLIAVSDTGQGMPAEVRARVFEPFFTTKTDGKGTGLGLSMVYGFVRQSNGHVQIYSEPGQGTTVKIYLPRSHQAEASPVRTEPGAAAGRGQTILVVEDDDNVRASVVALLETLGYRCREAANAEEALAALRADLNVDLVFSDVVMPGPLKTRDFAGEVEAMAPGVPILFTSGYTDNAIVHHGRLDPGVALLSKPYTRDDLARKVGQMLAPRAAAND